MTDTQTADPQIDVQVVINRLTTQIAQMTAEMAVKDALIDAMRSQHSDIIAEPALSVVEDDDA